VDTVGAAGATSSPSSRVPVAPAGASGSGASPGRSPGRGSRDVEREQVHVARLERAAEVVAGLGQQARCLGRVGDELGAHAGRRGLQAHLDAAEVLGPQGDLRVRDAALVGDVQQRADHARDVVQRRGALGDDGRSHLRRGSGR